MNKKDAVNPELTLGWWQKKRTKSLLKIKELKTELDQLEKALEAYEKARAEVVGSPGEEYFSKDLPGGRPSNARFERMPGLGKDLLTAAENLRDKLNIKKYPDTYNCLHKGYPTSVNADLNFIEERKEMYRRVIQIWGRDVEVANTRTREIRREVEGLIVEADELLDTDPVLFPVGPESQERDRFIAGINTLIGSLENLVNEARETVDFIRTPGSGWNHPRPDDTPPEVQAASDEALWTNYKNYIYPRGNEKITQLQELILTLEQAE